MVYFELTCTAYIKSDIEFKRSFEAISGYINYSFLGSTLEKLHEKDGFKYYVFSSFIPDEEVKKTKIYKSGSTYRFSIRSIDDAFIEKLSNQLRQNINNSDFLVVNTSKKTTKKFFITELYSATPTVITAKENKFWTLEQSGDLTLLQKQLQDNLEKKYKSYYKEDLIPTQNFIQLIEIKNQKPQNIIIYKNGKKITFFGNKFRVVPNEDEVSQKLAFLALGAGLGEKNSYGGGFCLAGGVR